MGSFLSLRMHAAASMLVDAVYGTEGAVFIDGKGGDDAIMIVRDDETALRGVRHQVAGSLAATETRLIRHEFSGVQVDRERHGKRVALTDGVEMTFILRERDEAWIGSRGDQFGRRQFPRCAVEAHGVDALAGRARVGADIDQVFGSGGRETHKEKDD